RREAHQADVGDGLQFEDEFEFLAFLTEKREAGGLACLGRECGVAQATATAVRGHEAGAGAHEVGEDPAVAVEHDGAVGDLQDEVAAVGTVAVAAGALGTVGRLGVLVEVEVEQGMDVAVDFEDDVATVASVTAVGAAERLELLAVDGGAAVAALAGADVQHHPVDEAGHGWTFSRPKKNMVINATRAGQGVRPWPAPIGSMSREVLPRCPLPDGRSGVCRSRNDVDGLATALGTELDGTGREGEQRVVAAASHVHAGVEVGAALAHDDLAGVDGLATEALDAESLRVRIATVTGAGCTLLVCHDEPSWG